MTFLPGTFPGGALGILGLSVALVVVAVAVLRLPAFVALIGAAVFVGLASAAPGPDPHRFVRAVDSVMAESGSSMGRLGFAVAMAAIIGGCLLESGAADKIVRRTVALAGEKRAGVVLLVCGFLLSAPVFVDVVFMLLLPLARALGLRTGRNYLLNALMVCGGASISNGTLPPAPGPLFAAESLRLETGAVIAAGLAFGLLPLAATLGLGRWLDRRMPVPVRPTEGSSLESLAAAAARPESELPGLAASLAPVAAPMLLIALASLLGLGRPGGAPPPWIEFFGNKNVALAVGAGLAVALCARRAGAGWRSVGRMLGPPLETAGTIILIVSAGGAYGAMIKNAGVGEAVRALAGGHSVNCVLLAWLVAAAVRAAQGSATVATITAVAIMLPLGGAGGFGVHPIYILLAIGFGSKFLSWMNDSGFWVLCRLGGLTQRETLRSWTPLVSAVSVLGLAEVLAASAWFPRLPPGLGR